MPFALLYVSTHDSDGSAVGDLTIEFIRFQYFLHANRVGKVEAFFDCTGSPTAEVLAA